MAGKGTRYAIRSGNVTVKVNNRVRAVAERLEREGPEGARRELDRLQREVFATAQARWPVSDRSGSFHSRDVLYTEPGGTFDRPNFRIVSPAGYTLAIRTRTLTKITRTGQTKRSKAKAGYNPWARYVRGPIAKRLRELAKAIAHNLAQEINRG